MEFKTTIGICLNIVINDRHYDIIEKLEKVKGFIVEKKSRYNFKAIGNGRVLKVGNGLEEEFTKFIGHIDNSLIWSGKENRYLLESGEYKSQLIDLEEGEIEFMESFIIDDETIMIYLNTEDWYASELEKLPNLGLDLSCEMNDIDGDFYEFKI
uniref:hypothetical protein n=1 Tax=Algoriphagus sp. TaxID=1872435 RepID=UPI0040471990